MTVRRKWQWEVSKRKKRLQGHCDLCSSRCSTVGGIAHTLGSKEMCHDVFGYFFKTRKTNQRIPWNNGSALSVKSYSITIHKLGFGFQWPSGRIATWKILSQFFQVFKLLCCESDQKRSWFVFPWLNHLIYIFSSTVYENRCLWILSKISAQLWP